MKILNLNKYFFKFKKFFLKKNNTGKQFYGFCLLNKIPRKLS